MIDKQFAGSISTRKLVIETALLNVLTAYSAQEGIDTLRRFPNVDGIVLDSEVDGRPCDEIIRELRKIRNDLRIITVSPSGHARCGGEDYHVSSYDPHDLLEQLNKVCPNATKQADADRESPSGSKH